MKSNLDTMKRNWVPVSAALVCQHTKPGLETQEVHDLEIIKKSLDRAEAIMRDRADDPIWNIDVKLNAITD
jgi:hypothetical protein